MTYGFIFSVLPVVAEDQSKTITISPAVNEISVDPGEKKTGVLRVYNYLDQPMPLRVYTNDFEAADIYGGMNFLEIAEPTISLSSWFNLDKPSLLVPAKNIQELKYTIDVPKDAEPGGHYGAVFFETVADNDTSFDNDVHVKSRVGALFMVTVSGDIFEKGRVMGATSSDKCSGVDCSFTIKKFREWGPVPYDFKFENTGNIHVKVKGKIEITNIFGQKVGEVEIGEQTVLPRATRYFEGTWLREPLLGYYKAKLTINYGSLNVTDQAETSFFAFPLKVFLGLIIVVLIVLFYKKIYPKIKYKMNKKTVQRENS